MITIRSDEWRIRILGAERRLMRAFPFLGHLRSASVMAVQMGKGLRREVGEANASRPRVPPRRNPDGRRLRSSAYQYGPGGRPRPPLGPGVAGGKLPAALKAGLVGVVGAGSFLGVSSAYINFTGDLPDVHAIAANPIPEDTIIYAADGSELADIHQNGVQHYWESFNSMGTLLPEATVAIEDANFWHEPGIDMQGIARAAWIDWRHQQAVQGASTITQQLVKLRLIGSEVSVTRKIKEAILAVQLEHIYTKKQILEQYLNTVHFGNNAQGSMAASLIYFHKPTKDLDLAQASMLAGIPQSPLYNSPVANWDRAKQRQHEVLDAMVKNHYVNQEQADDAYTEDLSQPNHMFLPGPKVFAAPNYVDWITNELRTRYGDNATYGGGLRVYTTLNPTLQHLAEGAVTGNVINDRSKGITQGAMVSVDPRTGAVLAMVGSADPNTAGGQFNMAIWPRNPGSSMKLWTYTAAIESGKFTMTTPVADSPISICQPGFCGPFSPKRYQPKNYDGRYHGTCIVQACIGNSLNVPAVKVELGTGIDHVVDVARRVGAPALYSTDYIHYSDPHDPSVFSASLTLGAYGETVLQQATGAATLADMGMYHQPFGIARIVTNEGKEIQAQWDPNKTAKQVVDPRVAFIMAQILSNNNNRVMIFGPSSPLTLPNRRVAAKTGTTENFTDAWTVGFTPSLASAFWFGDPYYHSMSQGFDAVFAAAPAWHAYMDEALGAMNAPTSEWYGVPAGLNVSGTSNGQPVYLLPGTRSGQPAPALPSWASSSSSAPNNNNNNDQNRRPGG